MGAVLSFGYKPIPLVPTTLNPLIQEFVPTIEQKDYITINNWKLDLVDNDIILMVHCKMLDSKSYFAKYLFEYQDKKFAFLNDVGLVELAKTDDTISNDKFMLRVLEQNVISPSE